MNNPSFKQSFSLPVTGAPSAEAEAPAFHSFGDLVGALRRHGLALAIWLLVCVAAAAAYLVNTPPGYVASTALILEPLRPAPGTVDVDGAYRSTLDAAQADSHIQLVKSERTLRFVFDTLSLADTPEFAEPPPGLRRRLMDLIAPRAPPTRDQRATAAFLDFTGRVGVRRIGQSYVLEITYSASNPVLAAQTVNSITSAYIRDRILSARRGGEYLQERISALDGEESAALDAVRQGKISDIRFPDADARVISAALIPTGKAFPQTSLVLAFAVVFGLISGLGVILTRHSFDRRMRTQRHVVRGLGLGCLAVLPALSARERRSRLQNVVPVCSEIGGAYFDALRATLASTMPSATLGQHRLIGITSWRSGEGRSSVARSLACLMAASGEPVVLVDADFCNPVLSEALAPDQIEGLMEALSNRWRPEHLPLIALSERMQFVRAVGHGQPTDRPVFMGSAEMRLYLNGLREQGTVIMDLSAMSLSSDAAAIGPLLDAVILVIEAGKTDCDTVSDSINGLRAGGTNVAGVILNKAQT